MFNFRKLVLVFFAFITYPTSSYKMIVLTGGPCAGKTSSLLILKQKLEEIKHEDGTNKFKVLILDEIAFYLFSKGDNPEKLGVKPFQKLVFETQLDKEKQAIENAKEIESKDFGVECIIICDRGLIDGAAYMNLKDYDKMLNERKITRQEILDRYNLVVHLPSFATLDNDLYTNLKENRIEDKQQAKGLDKKIYDLWGGDNNQKLIKIPITEGIESIDKDKGIKNRAEMILKEILKIWHYKY